MKCDDCDSQVHSLRKQIEEMNKDQQVQIQRVQTLSNDNAKLLEQIRIQQAVNGHSEVAVNSLITNLNLNLVTISHCV